jgi:hypothetical protein
MAKLPHSLVARLAIFEACFTAPSYRRFLTLVMGWIRCTGKHTVTGVMRAAGVVGVREHSGYHRFFSRGAWEPDSVGLALMRLVLGLLPKTARVTLTIDDTLGRHTGKHISSAGMHYDPLLSSAGRPLWHFGHRWVVLAVVVEFPRWGKSFSLPVLVRLYRTEKVNEQLGKPHRKLTELAKELLELVSQQFPRRQLVVVADASYVNGSVVRPLPDNIHLVGRGRMDAALYAKAPSHRGRGRPRVKGKKLPSPKERRGQWTSLDVLVYGRSATLEVKVFKAVWYKVSHGRQMLFVVVRGWPGHAKQDVLVSTDLEMSAKQVVELYCLRWSLEETFGWVKSRLGFEDPHNRTEAAVLRTAPMALWVYSLVIAWYARWSKGRSSLPMRLAPWYRTKHNPSFSDMLATLRRESWTLWISDQTACRHIDQKQLEPLLDAVGYA